MKMQKELPEMCTLFFRGIEPVTQPRTRLAYAYDLTVFFSFLINSRNEYKNHTLRDFKLRDIERITTTDLEEYLEYLKYRPDEDKEIINKESGLKRKLSSLKSFYNYLFRTERIKVNPAALLKLPKIHEKDIIRLEYDEVAALLDEADSGDKLTEKQKLYHKRTKTRDAAILTLLLGTGIVKEEHLAESASFFSRYMALFFIPAGVEVIENFEALRSAWIAVVIISLISLFVTFLAAAKAVEIAERIARRREA